MSGCGCERIWIKVGRDVNLLLYRRSSFIQLAWLPYVELDCSRHYLFKPNGHDSSTCPFFLCIAVELVSVERIVGTVCILDGSAANSRSKRKKVKVDAGGSDGKVLAGHTWVQDLVLARKEDFHAGEL